ncbi:MAG TPA: type I restriction endonuclease [Longimicrobiaceae bacterium]|jgi:hypothetical protein|nr:type I restriction endonuclease [Longimicrobiaceae bacterium]
MSEEFRARLNAHALTALERAGRAFSEAATQQYLILPFFQLLGYDPLDPDEIIPEAHASFSDKFKNRVDYAICLNKDPVIAVECKKVGTLVDANRGELKGYFNAVPTVKLGVLTDGLVYQLFTDTNLENMMDDEPFVVIDLSEIARDQVAEQALDALLKLRRGTFDPADVGADAKRKIYMAAYVDALRRNFEKPDERLVRVLMDLANIDGRRTTRLVEEHFPIVTAAIQQVLDKKILERVGFADREDVVRLRPEQQTQVVPEIPQPEMPPVVMNGNDAGVVTTETELAVYDYVRVRLPFLIGPDEEMYGKLAHLRPMDYKTVFSVYYKQERKGKLFNFREGTAPKYRFEFLTQDTTINTDDLREIDQALLAAFQKRVEELG